MKRISITILSVIALQLSALANTVTIGDMTYECYDDATATLTAGMAEGKAIIPAGITVDGKEYTVNVIGPRAFDHSRITSLSLPATIEKIESGAFNYAPYIERVDIPDLRSWLLMDFDDAAACPTYNYTPLYVDNVLLENVVIPDGITAIGNYAFYNCSSITDVSMGDNVTEIGDCAFDGCEQLRSATLGNGVQIIGNQAFSICVSLENISLPDSVRQLGQGVFYGCSSLKTVKWSSRLSFIPELTFAGCQSLNDLSFLPESVTAIGDYCFYFCHGLTDATLGTGLQKLGSRTFHECQALREVTFHNPDTKIGMYAFSCCPALTLINLPENMQLLSTGLLMECTSLPSIKIPAGVTEIGDVALANCSSLRYISFPDGMSKIGQQAMYGCASLRRLDFGAAVDSIKVQAFYKCPQLSEIHCHGLEPPAISFFTFDYLTEQEALLVVPEMALDLYADNLWGWGRFTHISGNPAYNPDTMLTVLWGGKAEVKRYVAYGTRFTLRLSGPDGALPSALFYNGTEVTDTLSPDGSFTTPPVTDSATLRIIP